VAIVAPMGPASTMQVSNPACWSADAVSMPIGPAPMMTVLSRDMIDRIESGTRFRLLGRCLSMR